MNKIKVTVGLMVYNEEKYLKESLKMLTSHDYGNYLVEIIIGDNASTDRSSEIINEFTKQDERIKHIKRNKNIGAIGNFDDIVRCAQGEYFVLAGGHDLWSDSYIKDLVDSLDNDRYAVIAFAPTVWINKDGCISSKKSGFVDTSGKNEVTRFTLSLLTDQHPIYGLIRLKALKKTRISVQVFISTALILAELSLIGTFVVVPNAVWFRRENRQIESRFERMTRYGRILFYTKRKMILPHWLIPWHYLKVIWLSKVTFFVKVKLFLACFNLFIKYSNSMLRDIFDLYKLLRFK